MKKHNRIRRFWYKLSKSPGGILGLGIIVIILILGVFAPYIAPYPEQAGAYVDFESCLSPPSLQHPFGVDEMGRDVFTRTIYGYRLSLLLAAMVLSIGVPLGVVVGLFAGYFGGWLETILMRLTDVFLPLPPLVMALAIGAVLKPNITNAMIAISALWWTWYARLLYNVTKTIQNEEYIQAAEIAGMSKLRIVFLEILPNCWSTILVKVTLDVGFVILIGAGLSFLGMGAQPPKPGLGTMISEGTQYLPVYWWTTVFPSLALLLLILGTNLLGDSLRDIFDVNTT
jgi:peptide/nickel transport system permease protein